MNDELGIYKNSDNSLSFTMKVGTDLYKELGGKVKKSAIDTLELYKELETMHMIQKENGDCLKEKVVNFENKIVANKTGEKKNTVVKNECEQRYKLKYKY